jgi:hypothetical protein
VLLERDAERAVAWLQQRKRFERKACEAVGDLFPVFAAHLSSNMLFDFVIDVFRRGSDWWERNRLLGVMADQFKDEVRIWGLIREAATKDRDGLVRQDALALLGSRQRDDPATWELIRKAAIQDPSRDVRSRACGLLLHASNCDGLQRRLMWRNLDEEWRDVYDPKELVTSQRIAYAAEKLGLSIDEVQRQYEAIADRLQIAIDLEWRKAN